MKINLIFVLASMLVFNSTRSQSNNDSANQVVVNLINTINSFIDTSNNVNVKLTEIEKIIKEVESITLIKSNSEVTFFGFYIPSKVDLNLWTDWLCENRHRLKLISGKVMVIDN